MQGPVLTGLLAMMRLVQLVTQNISGLKRGVTPDFRSNAVLLWLEHRQGNIIAQEPINHHVLALIALLKHIRCGRFKVLLLLPYPHIGGAAPGGPLSARRAGI
jgi:hypothetical protein